MDDPAARSPPPTPPRVVFDPPLFSQRRSAVVEILTLLHKHPRFNSKLKSLIDIGCGTECLLLQKLVAPNDDLPLEQVTGIDMDPMLWNREIVDAFKPENMTEEGGRWSKFGLTLLCGSFEQLSLGNVAHHDIVTSCEVIEHLDPEPLANFAKVLLGNLKPKICVITTPNREFNDIFTLPFTPLSGTPADVESEEPALPQSAQTPATADGRKMITVPEHCTSDSRYWREGVPYGMRHPDHRFEWTRREFRDWANDAAEKYGYTVCFTGVGGFRNGMCVINSSGAAVQSALRGGLGTGSEITEKAINEAFEQEDEGLIERASKMWGDCTQIAIFMVKEGEEESHESLVKLYDWSKNPTSNPAAFGPIPPSFSICPLNPWVFPNSISLVCHYDYPFVKEEEFPPKFITLMEMLEPELVNFLPGRMLEEWQKTPQQIMRDVQLTKRAKLTGQSFSDLYCQHIGDGSDSECDYGWDPEIDGDEAVRKGRKKERKVEKRKKKEVEEQILCGKRADLIRVVKVMGVPLKTLWESSNWKLKRACRHRFEAFKDVLMRVIDEVGSASENRSQSNLVSEKATENRTRCYCGKTRYYKVIINTTGVPLRDEDEDGYSSPYGVCPSCQVSKAVTPSPTMIGRKTQLDSSVLLSPICSSSRGSLESLSLPEPALREKSSGLRRSRSATISPDWDHEPVSRRSIFERSKSNSFILPAHNNNDEERVRSGLVRFAGTPQVWQENDPLTPPQTSHKKAKSLSSPILGFENLRPNEQEHELRRPFSPSRTSSTLHEHDKCEPEPETLIAESSLDMFVKLYSVAATRSVVDLIRSGLTEKDKQILRRWRLVRVEMNPFAGESELQEELSEVHKELAALHASANDVTQEDISAWTEISFNSAVAMDPAVGVSPMTPLDGMGWDYFGLPSSVPSQNLDESVGACLEQPGSSTSGGRDNALNDEKVEQGCGGESNPTGTAANDANGDVNQSGTVSQEVNDGIEETSSNRGSDGSESDSGQSNLDSVNEYDMSREFSSFPYYSFDEPNDYDEAVYIPKKYRMELIYGLEYVDSTLSTDTPLTSREEKGKWKSTTKENQNITSGTSGDDTTQVKTNKDVSRFMVLFSSSGIGISLPTTYTSIPSALGQAGISSPRVLTISWPAYQSSLQRVTRWIEKRREMQREGNLYFTKKILVRKIEWDEWCKRMDREELENEKEKFNELSQRRFKLKIEGEEGDIMWKEEAMQAAGWNENGEDDGTKTEIGVVVYKPRSRWIWEGPEDEPEVENEKEREKGYGEAKVWWIADNESKTAKETETDAQKQGQKKDAIIAAGPAPSSWNRRLSVSGLNGAGVGVR